MTFSELLKEYKEYLLFLNPANPRTASSYRSYLNRIYQTMPKAKDLLDSIAHEHNYLIQRKSCIQLIELIHFKEKFEKDRAIQHRLSNWHSAAVRLLDFIYDRKCSIYGASSSEKNILGAVDQKTQRGTAHPYPLLSSGEDQPTNFVHYASDVEPNEQVPGLCRFLTDEYGRILDFASRIFGLFFSNQLPYFVPVELSKKCPTKTYYNEDDYITEKVNERIKRGERITREDMQKILRIFMRIGGEFHSTLQPHIVIYYRQFDMSCFEEYQSALAQTLAYVFAQYMEFSYCQIYGATPFMDDRVSAAIAGFFGVLYSIHKGQPCDLRVAEATYNEWVEFFESSWPHANALYFYPYDDRGGRCPLDFAYYSASGSIEKLQDVFSSTINASEAYHKLTR